MPRVLRTPDIERQILGAIRAGAHPRVAALAAGIPPALFTAWLQQGQQRARGRYRHLWLAVCQARAWARLRAELDVRQKDLKFWLRYGPRTGPGALPAWGVTRPTRSTKREAGALDALQPVIDCLLVALEPFPEAKRAVLQALANSDSASGPGPAKSATRSQGPGE